MHYLHFFKKILLSNFIRLRLPYKLTFSLTNKCNLCCTICRIWEQKGGGELSFSDIDLFFKKSNWFSWISLTGGEIFIRRDLGEITKTILSRCKKLCILHFSTNGQLTDKILSTAEEISRYGAVRLVITVSIDGPEKLHDRLKGQAGAFKRSAETFRELKKIKGINAYIGTTLSHYNSGAVNELFNSLKLLYNDLSRDDLHINLFHKSEHFYNNCFLPERDNSVLEKAVRDLLSFKGRHFKLSNFLERNYLGYALSYLRNGRSPLPCQALSASCFIDARGVLYPCITNNLPLGNIKDFDYDIGNVWQRDDIRKAHSACRSRQCPNCWTPCEAYQGLLGSLMRMRVIY